MPEHEHEEAREEVDRPDAPNQQLVRDDQSGPADAGEGGPRPENSSPAPEPEQPAPEPEQPAPEPEEAKTRKR